MSEKLMDLMKNIENLDKEELKKIQTWVDFCLNKKLFSNALSLTHNN